MKKPIRILFVEADRELAAVYEDHFPAPEFRVLTAADGEQAFYLLHEPGWNFDVLLTDTYMPHMEGYAFLRKVRKDFPNLKFVMISGCGSCPDYTDAHHIGVSKFLDKPIKMAELKELIRTLVG